MAIVAALAVLSPAFRDPANLLGIGRQVAMLGIAAAAMTLVIPMGEIDLSMGAVASAAAVVTALALAQGRGIWAVPLALATGTAFGLFNGALAVGLGVPSFIATLVGFFLAQGVALTLTGGKTILFSADGFRAVFATGNFLGQRSAVWWLLAVFLLTG